MQYTNNYSILKDILKNEYILVLSLLFNNFNDIIHLLKKKMPLDGEILEYIYLSQPLYYNSIHDEICTRFSYIDNVTRTLYKNLKREDKQLFKNNINKICNLFHLNNNEFDFYYFIAIAIIALESSISKEANDLYNQIDDNKKNVADSYLLDFFNILSKEEFQCLFYNHLEDVYESNISVDKKISFIHKNNYSYFLDRLDKKVIFQEYLPLIKNKRYPIIITDSYIYIITNSSPCILEENHIDKEIFDESIRYIASYYIDDMTIRNWIPFFNYFNKYQNPIDLKMINELYNSYSVQYPLYDSSLKLLKECESFVFFDNDISNNIHYYIDKFSLYSNELLKLEEEEV